MKLLPPITGPQLLERVQHLPEHIPLIEGLLYEHDSLMISSDSGKGKSLIGIQVAMHLTKPTPVFGALRVARPLRVWYMQMERHENESLERINKLMHNFEWDANNLFLDTEPQILNFINPAHYPLLEERGLEIKPDVIFIDPLYGVAQGLSQDKIAAEVSKCLTMLKKRLGCAIWINHHVVKDQYFEGKKVEKDDPFYGATWIRAHVTGSYFMRQIDTGLEFIKKKDNHDVLLDHIVTTYDHETYLSTVDPDKFNYHDRLKIFLNQVNFKAKKTFEFTECRAFVGCASRTLRYLLTAHPYDETIKRHKASGSKTIYEIVSLI